MLGVWEMGAAEYPSAMTKPLAGVKVVEFAEHGFVPAAAAALTDWGADVVKIERFSGDAMRTIISSGLVASDDGYDYLFEIFNRNKRCIALDVEAPSGRAVFERLIAWADVYITNQLPRVRRKLRTEPDDLLAINPRLVFARGSGQGQRGVDAEAGGFDSVSYWARGSAGHSLTPPGSPKPIVARAAMGDIPSGMFLAGGVCAALVHVARTGRGTVVDTSLLNAATCVLAPDMAYTSLFGGQLPTSDDSMLSPITQTYRTIDGRFVQLMMIDDVRYWEPACRALGVEDLCESHPDPESRRVGRLDLTARLRQRVGEMTLAELEAALRAEGCIYSRFQTPAEVLEDPAVVDNGYVMAHPVKEGLRVSAAPSQFDDELPAMTRPAPGLGEHSREVLAEIGLGQDEVDRLVADGVVRTG